MLYRDEAIKSLNSRVSKLEGKDGGDIVEPDPEEPSVEDVNHYDLYDVTNYLTGGTDYFKWSKGYIKELDDGTTRFYINGSVLPNQTDSVHSYGFEQYPDLTTQAIVRVVVGYGKIVLVTYGDGIYYTTASTINENTGFTHVTTSTMGLSATSTVYDAECASWQGNGVLYVCVKKDGIYSSYYSDLSSCSVYHMKHYDAYQLVCFDGTEAQGGVYVATDSSHWTRNKTLPTAISGTCSCYDPSTGYYMVGFTANNTGNGGVWYTQDPSGTWTQASGNLSTMEIKSIVAHNGKVKVGGKGIWETNDITQGFTLNTSVSNATGYYMDYDSNHNTWWAIASNGGYNSYYSMDDGSTWELEKSLPNTVTPYHICIDTDNDIIYIPMDGQGVYYSTETDIEGDTNYPTEKTYILAGRYCQASGNHNVPLKWTHKVNTSASTSAQYVFGVDSGGLYFDPTYIGTNEYYVEGADVSFATEVSSTTSNYLTIQTSNPQRVELSNLDNYTNRVYDLIPYYTDTHFTFTTLNLTRRMWDTDYLSVKLEGTVNSEISGGSELTVVSSTYLSGSSVFNASPLDDANIKNDYNVIPCITQAGLVLNVPNTIPSGTNFSQEYTILINDSANFSINLIFTSSTAEKPTSRTLLTSGGALTLNSTSNGGTTVTGNLKLTSGSGLRVFLPLNSSNTTGTSNVVTSSWR